jgi:regulator of replication initiation timing
MKQKLLIGFADTREVVETGLNTVEHVFLTLATRAAPWLAPLGPAILIYRALQHRLGVNPVAAGAMGLAVELVGIATAHLTVNCWQWNQTRRKSDPTAPTRWAAAMTALYLAGAVAVSTILDVWPDFAPYAPVVFFLLAGCAYGSLALGSQLTHWQDERTAETLARRSTTSRIDELSNQVEKLTGDLARIQDEAEKLRSEREKLATENEKLRDQIKGLRAINQPESQQVLVVQDDPRRPKGARFSAERIVQARQVFVEDPDISGAELGRRLGISERKGRDLLKLTRAQVLVQPTYSNGAGKESGHG